MPDTLCSWDFPGKNTGVSCHFFLQGIFLIQGWNPRLPCLLWQMDSLPLNHLGSLDGSEGRTSNRITATGSVYLIALCETRAQHSFSSLNCPLRCPKMIKSKLSEIKWLVHGHNANANSVRNLNLSVTYSAQAFTAIFKGRTWLCRGRSQWPRKASAAGEVAARQQYAKRPATRSGARELRTRVAQVNLLLTGLLTA